MRVKLRRKTASKQCITADDDTSLSLSWCWEVADRMQRLVTYS